MAPNSNALADLTILCRAEAASNAQQPAHIPMSPLGTAPSAAQSPDPFQSAPGPKEEALTALQSPGRKTQRDTRTGAAQGATDAYGYYVGDFLPHPVTSIPRVSSVSTSCSALGARRATHGIISSPTISARRPLPGHRFRVERQRHVKKKTSKFILDYFLREIFSEICVTTAARPSNICTMRLGGRLAVRNSFVS